MHRNGILEAVGRTYIFKSDFCRFFAKSKENLFKKKAKSTLKMRISPKSLSFDFEATRRKKQCRAPCRHRTLLLLDWQKNWIVLLEFSRSFGRKRWVANEKDRKVENFSKKPSSAFEWRNQSIFFGIGFYFFQKSLALHFKSKL